MKAHVQDSRVMPEDLLCPISVVHIPIHDRHPFYPMLLLGGAGADCDIVEKAESHCARGHGMMSRRPNRAKDISLFLSARDFDPLKHTPHSEQRCAP